MIGRVVSFLFVVGAIAGIAIAIGGIWHVCPPIAVLAVIALALYAWREGR